MVPTKQDYKTIYQLLDYGPLSEDCGLLCQAACCKVYSPTMGIYLLPGEEQMFNDTDKQWLVWEKHDPKRYDFPPSWANQPVYFVKCVKPCPREKRPIQCRTFPLTPHLTSDNRLILIWETLSLPYKCPLITNKAPLNPAFVNGLKQGWELLIEYPLIRDLISWDSRSREKDRHPIVACQTQVLQAST